MSARYRAERRDGAWYVLDSTTGQVLAETYSPGPAGAAAAGAAASARNQVDHRQVPSKSASDLRAWRKAHGLTQAQLAARLGVAWLTLQRWESGYASAPAYLFLALKGLETDL